MDASAGSDGRHKRQRSKNSSSPPRPARSGLRSPAAHQAADPRLPGLAATGLDMDQDECNLLIDYVRNLPVPVASRPVDEKDAAQIKAGEATFKAIGCTGCHLPKLGDVEGFYSDMLLHDMGAQLADADNYTVFSGEPAQGDRARARGSLSPSHRRRIGPRVANASSLGSSRLSPIPP